MKVIEAAAEEARTLGHEHVGTEHLLLGLVAEGAPAVLAALGSEVGDLGRLRSVARELLPRGVERPEVAIESSAAGEPTRARPDRPQGAIVGSLGAAAAALQALLADEAALSELGGVVSLLAERFRAGQKVLICGNGGSACDAAHFAEELTGRFRAPPAGKADRPALPAIACTDAGHITCTANDYGFDHVFSRWVEALGKQGDVLIVLSTSGNSANVVKAAEAGRARGLTTVALLGKDGGRLRGVCDHEIIVPGEGSDRVQELHMLILHVLVEGVEREMFGW